MPTSDESNRGLDAPDLPSHSTMKSTSATPAKRKTYDGKSPGKPHGFTLSPTSKKLRSPGCQGHIVGVFPEKKGKTWRTLVPEGADQDDNERN